MRMCSAFENFVVRGAVDFLQPDVARASGVTEIKKIAALAAGQKVPISFHTWGDAVALGASVYLSTAMPECTVMELDYTYNPLREELLVEAFQVENGFLIAPDKPGLGVELSQRHCNDSLSPALRSWPRQKVLAASRVLR